MTEWIICNQKTMEYWSNQYGWVDMKSADRFTDEEKQELNLPLEGTWQKV